MITLPLQAKPYADQDLQYRIALYVQQRQLALGARLKIEATRGVVTLKGTVPNYHQRQLLYSFARRVAGAVAVVDELEVDLPPCNMSSECNRPALAI